LLQPGEIQLVPSADVLNPTVNNLDLRYRSLAQVKARTQVNIALLTPKDAVNTSTLTNLCYLQKSVTALYPNMLVTEIEQLSSLKNVDNLDCDLLYLKSQELLTLPEDEIDNLQQYLATGAVLLVEASEIDANIVELSAVKQQLQTAIANLTQDSDIAQIRQELENELKAIETNIAEQLSEISLPIRDFAQRVGIEVTNSNIISRNHPLRHEPFLFAQLPIVKGHPMQLFNWGGIVFAIGSLSSAWGIDDALSLSRESIRTAQEMGINILHFAWRRHQLTQLQQVKS
jgi:hypothetical protein